MATDSAENRKHMSSTLDSFSIANFYIRKDRPRGHRYGKAPGCKEYHTAHQLAKKCRKKGYESIYDRYIRDKAFRSAMICRRIISYTSYLRTNDCTNNGYVTDILEHNTMINIDTVAHMILHYTQSWAHWAHFIDALHVTSWLKSSSPRHSIHACSIVRCVVVVLFTRLLFPLRSVALLPDLPDVLLRVPQRSSSLKTCATSAWGPWPVLTTRHPSQVMSPTGTWTSWIPKSSDLAATSDIYWQHTFDDNTSRNDTDVDDDQLAMYLAGVVDSTGKPVAQRSGKGQFSWDTRNLKSAQNQFPVVSRPEMICQFGGSVQTRVAEEREIAQAQIRTMLDEQRRILTAECSEKVLHHELLAAHAEQDRKVLHEELRQQQEFREVRQQDLMRHLELQKFQNSESQKTIMNLSGRLQELLKWSKFHEWFQGFYGCWIDLQWKSTRYQSTWIVP